MGDIIVPLLYLVGVAVCILLIIVAAPWIDYAISKYMKWAEKEITKLEKRG